MLWIIQRKASLLLPIPKALPSEGRAKAGGLLLHSTCKDHLLCTHRVRIPGSCGVQRGQGQGPHAKSWHSVG